MPEGVLRVEAFEVGNAEHALRRAVAGEGFLAGLAVVDGLHAIMIDAGAIDINDFGKFRGGNALRHKEAVGIAHDVVRQRRGIDVAIVDSRLGCRPREVGLIVKFARQTELHARRRMGDVRAEPLPERGFLAAPIGIADLQADQ